MYLSSIKDGLIGPFKCCGAGPFFVGSGLWLRALAPAPAVKVAFTVTLLHIFKCLKTSPRSHGTVILFSPDFLNIEQKQKIKGFCLKFAEFKAFLIFCLKRNFFWWAGARYGAKAKAAFKFQLHLNSGFASLLSQLSRVRIRS